MPLDACERIGEHHDSSTKILESQDETYDEVLDSFPSKDEKTCPLLTLSFFESFQYSLTSELVYLVSYQTAVIDGSSSLAAFYLDDLDDLDDEDDE